MMIKKIRFEHVSLLLTVIYILVCFFYIEKHPLFSWDETFWMEPSCRFLTERSFSSPSSFPPDLGFETTNVAYGRIFLFINAIIFYLLGIGIWQMRLLSFISGIMVLLLTYLIAIKLFSNKKIAAFSVLILATSHLFMLLSRFVRPEMLVTLFLLLALYLFLRAEEKGSKLLYFLSGLSASLSIDVHLPGVISIFMFALLILNKIIKKELNYKFLLAATAGVITGLLWWIIMHLVVNYDIFFFQMQNFWNSGNYLLLTLKGIPKILLKEFQRYYQFFWVARPHRNMYWLLLFAISFIYLVKNSSKKSYRTLLLALLGAIIGFTFVVPGPNTFYLMFIFPLLVISVSNFLYQYYCSNHKFKRFVAITLTLGLFILLSAENFYKFYYFRKADYDSYISKIKPYIPENSVVMGQLTNWLGFRNQPYYGDLLLFRNGSYQWQHLKKYLSEKNVRYLIVDKWFYDFASKTNGTEQLNSFIKNNCILVGAIEDEFYGSYEYTNKPETLITEIYNVKKNN